MAHATTSIALSLSLSEKKRESKKNELINRNKCIEIKKDGKKTN